MLLFTFVCIKTVFYKDHVHCKIRRMERGKGSMTPSVYASLIFSSIFCHHSICVSMHLCLNACDANGGGCLALAWQWRKPWEKRFVNAPCHVEACLSFQGDGLTGGSCQSNGKSMDRAVNRTGNRSSFINIYLIWTSLRLSGCDVGVALCQPSWMLIIFARAFLYPMDHLRGGVWATRRS